MEENKQKKENNKQDDINSHLYIYSPSFLEEINKTKKYKPSLLFSWDKRLIDFITNYLKFK